MKKLVILLLGFMFCMAPANAQLLKRLKNKVNKKLKQTEQKIEKKIEKGVDDLLFGKDSTSIDVNDQKQNKNQFPKTIDELETSQKQFEAYSKYDFVPGKHLKAFEDFSQDTVGDFPSNWNTSASAEVVTTNMHKGNWLRIGQNSGVFTYSGLNETLEEDFTLEFDLMFDFEADSYAFKRYFNLLFSTLEDPNQYMNDFTPGKDYISISFTNGSGSGRYVGLTRKSSQKGMDLSSKNDHPFFSKNAIAGTVAHISILKKGQRLKVYVNEDKVIDVPQSFLDNAEMKSFRFQSNISPDNQHFYLSNLKYATGVDLPESIFAEGTYQAHGIQFETGKADILPTSYETLKMVAQQIKTDDGEFYIIGHTDVTGNADENQKLSELRAMNVYQVLVNNFDISKDKLSANGVGSREPLSTENTPTAYALNRRVEIKKL